MVDFPEKNARMLIKTNEFVYSPGLTPSASLHMRFFNGIHEQNTLFCCIHHRCITKTLSRILSPFKFSLQP